MLERDVEKYLVAQTRTRGGRAAKWVSPGWTGVPDRLVFLPGHPVFGVEVKAPGRKATPIQCRVHDQLRALGFSVFLVDSKESIDRLFAGDL